MHVVLSLCVCVCIYAHTWYCMVMGLIYFFFRLTLFQCDGGCLAVSPAPGCSQTYNGVVLGDWQDPLEPVLDAQIIYSQLHHSRDTLR